MTERVCCESLEEKGHRKRAQLTGCALFMVVPGMGNTCLVIETVVSQMQRSGRETEFKGIHS